MFVTPKVCSLGMRRWGWLAAVVIVCGCPRPPLVDERHPKPKVDAGVDAIDARDAQDAVDARDAADAPPMTVVRPTRYIANNRNIDLLFLVDDSASMRLSQNNLLRNFPVLMRTLENLQDGLPNVHIGVISSDMGAGDGSIGGCDAVGGKRGILQYTPRGTCNSSGLAAGATYISNVDGIANYTGALPDVFTCIAALGEDGCGFEHQFASITRALGVDGFAAPNENQGFLRPDALLAVVMITNEDDCSASRRVALFDTGSNTNIASQLGPPANFRCNEFGHLCMGDHPDRRAPGNDVNATVTYEGCRSNDEGYLLAVRDTANRIKSLKADDGQIMISAITGPLGPYIVGWRPPRASDTSCGASSCPWPEIKHSCTADDGSFGDPAVRINELLGYFGQNGRLLSICESDFAPALDIIANNIAKYVKAPCIMGQIAKRPGTDRDDCTVRDNMTGGSVVACADSGGSGTCWQLVAGMDACNGVSVSIQTAPGTAAPRNLTVECNMCVAGVPDPSRGCP